MSDPLLPADSTPASDPSGIAAVPTDPAREKPVTERPALDPTRYGDWEKNGRCIDF